MFCWLNLRDLWQRLLLLWAVSLSFIQIAQFLCTSCYFTRNTRVIAQILLKACLDSWCTDWEHLESSLVYHCFTNVSFCTVLSPFCLLFFSNQLYDLVNLIILVLFWLNALLMLVWENVLNIVFEDVITDCTIKVILFWSRLGYPTRSLLLWS